MNRTEYKNDIERHKANALRFSKRQVHINEKIKELEKESNKMYNDWCYENGLTAMLEVAIKKEADAKRKVTGYLKKYPLIWVEDESDHRDGERGTYLWLFSGLYDAPNEEDDPYYDAHYMDDWVECQERCEVYIEAIEKKAILEVSA